MTNKYFTMNKYHVDFDDLVIVPAAKSYINSRSECKLPDILPLFTAPMDTVINGEICMFSKTLISVYLDLIKVLL